VKSQPINVTLIEIQNPKIFNLIFSAYWKEFMQQVDNFIDIEITDIPKTGFDYFVIILDEFSIQISISYSVNISNGTLLFISVLKPQNISSSDFFYIEPFTGNETLEEVIICSVGFFYDSGSFLYF